MSANWWEILEKAGLKDEVLKQIDNFARPDMDPDSKQQLIDAIGAGGFRTQTLLKMVGELTKAMKVKPGMFPALVTFDSKIPAELKPAAPADAPPVRAPRVKKEKAPRPVVSKDSLGSICSNLDHMIGDVNAVTREITLQEMVDKCGVSAERVAEVALFLGRKQTHNAVQQGDKFTLSRTTAYWRKYHAGTSAPEGAAEKAAALPFGGKAGGRKKKEEAAPAEAAPAS